MNKNNTPEPDIPENTNDETPEAIPIKKKIWKLYVVLGTIALGMLVILGALFKIQVIDSAKYQKQANRQHKSRVELLAHRGNIYDRSGSLIVTSGEKYSIAIDPALLKQTHSVDSTVTLLSQCINIDAKELRSKIMKSKSRFMWIARSFSPESSHKFKKLKNILGIILREESGRIYTFADVASQIIGCTNIDNKGLTGIELSLDSVLRGKDGYAIMNRDSRGRLRPLANLPQVQPKHGNAIQLTIDMNLQRIVEYELKQGVTSSMAEAGSVVAVDPATGEILAMASYPNFDPNDLSTLRTDPLRNPSVTDLYEPGSTFKTITAAAAIEEGKIHPNDIVNGLGGEKHFQDYTIVDDHAIGEVTFREAFAKSSNIVLSEIASELSDKEFFKYIRNFGFGIKTGIELPGETTGRLKDAREFDITARRFAGYGYGIAVTPLQLAMAYAAIANKGILYKPYIVKNVFSPNGRTILANKPQMLRRVVSEETAKITTELLANVVNEGTGINAKLLGLSIAGKTGTAQQLVDGSYKNKKYTASFAGFFPANNPKIAMVVILDRPQNNYYGGSVAAPIFRNIAQRWVSMSPNVLLAGSRPFVHADSVVVPNLKGMSMQDAHRLLKIYGLAPGTYLNPKKKEVVIRQDPAPGSWAFKNTPVYLGTTIASDSLRYANPQFAATIKPNLLGLAVRRALNILHNNGYKARIIGNGKVYKQNWEIKNKQQICVIYCR